MPEFQFTSPDGKSYSITGPEGATREQAFAMLPRKYPELGQRPEFAGGGEGKAPQPQPPAQQPSTLQSLGRQLGLMTRYTLETIASPVTGVADAVGSAVGETARRMGSSYRPAETGKALSNVLTKVGLPEPASTTERAVEQIVEAAPLLAAGAGLAVKAVKPVVSKLAEAYSGKEVHRLAGEAATTIKSEATLTAKAHELAAMKQEQLARREAQKAESAAAQRQRLEKALATPPKTSSLDAVGSSLRGAVDTAMKHASDFRSAEGEKLFQSAKAAAAKKAAEGKFIDTAAALKPVEELLSHVQGVPGLEEKVAGMKNMLQAGVAKQKPATVLLDKHGEPLVVGGVEKAPMTFEHAEVIRRYLNDIAYSADMEGYPGIARKAARDAVKGLDEAMGKYVPEFKQYKEGWAQLSKPLESMGTKLGRAVFGAEGGVKGDAYQKVAAADLPGRFFGNREGVATLVDALAGGKGAVADPAARAHAEKLVEQMADKYFMERSRQMGAEAMQKFMGAPAQRGVMETLPGTAQKLTGETARRTGLESRVGGLKEAEKAAVARAAVAAKQAREFRATINDLREGVFQADTLAAQGSEKSKREAMGKYLSVLDGARKAGTVADSDYKAMIAMLDRVKSADERMAKLRHYARSALWFAGLGFGTEQALHHLGN